MSIDQLRGQVRGDVISPRDNGYEEARRVFNARIDGRPDVIVRPVDPGDVVAAVHHARENSLELSVRGGGHSVAGYGTNNGGLVVDLSRMREVSVDPASQTARAEGGAMWGDFNAATHTHGLATPGTTGVSTPGVAGLTLGGGIGYLARRFGLTSDNLVSAEVVTADARMLVASEDENADLFWALRGGGGNFGVVTSFEFRAHPVKEVYGGLMFYEVEESENILRFYREYIANAPEEMGAFIGFHMAPPLPFIPENRHGDTFMAIVACWAGPLEEGERVFKPFHEVAEVKAEMVAPLPYPAINSLSDALVPSGLQHYWKGNFVKELTDEAIAAHVQHGPKIPSVSSIMHLYPIDGACHRVGSNATAFGHRDANFAMVIAGAWPDPRDNERNIAWVRDYAAATAPFCDEGGPITFMSEDDQGRVRANYGANYDRLLEVKREYDPDNLFHVNQNIQP